MKPWADITPDQFRRAEELYHRALERPEPERLRFLETECADDPAVLAAVKRLLQRDDSPLPEVIQHSAESDEVDPATQTIRNYRLLERVGEGGMGVVYRAEQLEPVRRTVALKLIKWGADSEEIVRRFEAERQTLALMSHPNIAAVLDAGTTEEGRPYFAMELVDGMPITDYCKRRNLSLRERLELLATVCGGVQHAHQRGVIHRDLKPSNVLVVEQDGRPVPKIIDFGVAKALARSLGDHTLLTRTGQVIGTPDYMSPEQAAGGADVVDTRTDVYSLGALLYEILVGARPFELFATGQPSLQEVLRTIRDVEPLRPSRRVTSASTANTAPGAAGTDASTLSRRLRGDLDWITMRALEKDPARRYASVSELAADLNRHLSDEPVAAGPPSASYRMGKFVRRHRIGVAAAAVTALALVSGTILAVAGMQRARQAESAAKKEADVATGVTDFLIDLFEVSEPGDRAPKEITADELLQAGAEKVRADEELQPLVRARLLHTLGQVYEELDDHGQAIPLLEESLELRRANLTPPHEDLAVTQAELAMSYRDMDRLDEARDLMVDALEQRRQLHGSRSTPVANTLNVLGLLEKREGEYELARDYFDEAIAILIEIHGSDHLRVGEIQHNLGGIYNKLGRYADARDTLRRALAISEREYGADHDDVAIDLITLGTAHMELAEYDEATACYERAKEIFVKVRGPESPAVAVALTNLGIVKQRQGDLEGSRDSYLRAMEIEAKAFGHENTRVGVALINLGSVEHAMGRYDWAGESYARAAEILEKALGSDHVYMTYALAGRADVLAARGSFSEAIEIYDGVLAARSESLGESHAEVAQLRSNLADLLRQADRAAEALQMIERAIEDGKQGLGEGHDRIAEMYDIYAAVLDASERPGDAEQARRRAASIRDGAGF